MKRIGILIVTYNAESTVVKVLERIPEAVMAKIEEITVIDDASQDGTFDVACSYKSQRALSKLTVLRNPVNLRYGGNQKRGYRYAMERGLDIAVLLHGDGQYAPEVMQNILTPLEEDRADLVMGSRMLIPGAARRGRMPLYKYLGNRILSTTQNHLLGTQFTEFHSGYRAYNLAALRELPFDQMTDTWHFDTQIILELLRRGKQVVEVPIPTYYGDEICHVNGIPYAWHCIWTTALFAIATGRWPRLSIPEYARCWSAPRR